MTTVDDFAQGILREYNTFARQCVALVAEIGDEERAADCFAMEDLPGVAERLGGLRARAEAAEQRAEAAERELAQARADRTLMTGLWLGTVPHDVLPALFPETLADRGRITAALAAVDLQASAAAHIAAGRAVIARIVAEMGGGAA